MESIPSVAFFSQCKMRITVAVCTWNRCRQLDEMLQSATALRVPSEREWEILVVNNGGETETEQVLKRFETRLPLRWVDEPRLGLSRARNRAIDEARGDYLLWTDDDVLVDENWLINYLAAIDAFPEATIFGGPIDVEFVGAPPFWLKQHFPVFLGAYAHIDLGAALRPLLPSESPYGANMMLRRDGLVQCRFDEHLGPSGTSQIRGDELSLFRRLRRRGCEGVWVGGARVRHRIQPSRMTLDYIWNYYEGHGRTLVRSQDESGRAPAGKRDWMWNLLGHRVLFGMPLPSRAWFRLLRRAAIQSGMRKERRERLPGTGLPPVTQEASR